MIDHLKKYWVFLFIALIGINYAGFHLLLELVGISDALEHVESEEVIRKLKQEDFIYTIFVDFVLIIDFWLILFFPYLIIRNMMKNKMSKSNKK